MRDNKRCIARIRQLIAEQGVSQGDGSRVSWRAMERDAVLVEQGLTTAAAIRSFWQRHGSEYDGDQIEPDVQVSPATDDAQSELIRTITENVLQALQTSGTYNTIGDTPAYAPVQPVTATRETTHKPIIIGSNDMPEYGREVALFDIHHPKHDKRAWASVLAFLRDYKPDTVLYVGDAMDAGPFAHWNEKKLNLLRTMPPAHEMYGTFGTDILLPVRRAVGDNAHIRYMLGNHEDWIRQAIEADPRGEGYWEVERNVGDLVDSVVPYISEYDYNHVNIGKLFFIHGYTTNLYHARKVADDYNRPVRYGHTHDMQLYTHRTAVDVHDFHIARSCGCLCNLNPVYAKNRPNRWVHGFQYGEVQRDGSFADEVPVIIGGRFRADGVWYGG